MLQRVFRADAPIDDKLLSLIRQKRNDEAKAIIVDGNLNDVRDSLNNTLLHIAAQSNNSELVKYLIDSGSNVDARDGLGRTPLAIAVQNNFAENIKILIEAGANINIQDNLGRDILETIETFSRLGRDWNGSILKLLLKKVKTDCSNDKEEIAQKFIDAQWPLIEIIKLRDADVTRIVLKHKCSDFDWDMQRGYRPKTVRYSDIDYALQVAICCEDDGNVEVLLSYSKDRSILYSYCCKEPNKIFNVLKMQPDRLVSTFKKASQVLQNFGMFRYGNRDLIKLLLGSDMDTSLFDRSGETIVHTLVKNVNPGVIEQLSDKRFDINLPNRYGQTPLMIAAIRGDERAVEFLLNQGAAIEATDELGMTALWYAVERCETRRKGCVRVLLEYGANVQIQIDLNGISKTIFELLLGDASLVLEKLVLSQLAVQEARGTKVIRMDVINSHEQLRTYFNLSKQQLLIKVYESLTLLDLLTTTDKQFESYARNKVLVSKVQSFIKTLGDFDYFYTILQRQLLKAFSLVRLRTEAASMICNFMQIDCDTFFLIAEIIIGYLDLNDMRNLRTVAF